jgi:glucose-1-phosphatase
MNETIKNIIFDLGGVLVGLDSARCINAFRHIGCDDVAVYVEQHRTEDLFLDIELGRATTQDFCQEVRTMSHCAATDSEIVWAWNQLLTSVAAEKKARLKELAGQYRLFLLSNTNEMHWLKCRDELLPSDGCGGANYFERVFLSYEMQKKKPDADIFQQVLHDAGISAAETLFIDDSADNCRTAASLGMATLHETTGGDWLMRL